MFVLAACAAGGLALAAGAMYAEAQEPPVKVSVKGRVAGGQQLLNPVWNEAKDPKNHRYTFRMPSTTVSKNAKTLSAYLPKEVAIVALSADTAPAKSTPFVVHVSGGRTSPVTIVVGEGQNVQFINDDPFPHKLYSLSKEAGTLGPEETKPSQQRTWQPPKAGVYEVRDAYFPSVRSWVVVEPRAAGVGAPTTKNEFVVSDLEPGAYELRAYFNGAAVGEPQRIELRPAPDVQQLPLPLKLAESKGDKSGGDKSEGDKSEGGAKDEEKKE
jgi:hypothetical protein